MRGKVAKELRHQIYKDGSKRNSYEYSKDEKGTLRCVGKRMLYLGLKKQWLKS